MRLEGDDPRSGKVLLEAEDVLDLGAPPAIDGLVLVADRAEGLGFRPEELDERVLGGVRVLVLVDQEVPEAPALLGGDRRAGREEPHRAADQVVEIEGARRGELLLVESVDLGDPLAGEVGLLGGESLDRDERILRRGDPGPNGVGREHVGRDPQLFHGLLDQTELIGGVRDREPRRQLRLAVSPAQEAQTPGVERPDEGAERRVSGERQRPLPHLPRRLVRERHGRDRARVGAGADEPGQAVRDDAGLPRARAGEHEERTLLVEDRFALFGIEPGQEIGVGHRRIIQVESRELSVERGTCQRSTLTLNAERSTLTSRYSTVTDLARFRG